MIYGTRPEIRIAVQCYNFQHRLAWLLSSLQQQTVADKIVVDIAYLQNNGSPTTESLIQLHLKDNKPLWVFPRCYTDQNYFQYRGYTRNDQIASNDVEWLLFADTDHVYHPKYFQNLLEWLKTDHKNSPNFFSAGRQSCPPEQANALVSEWYKESNGYTEIIPRAWEKADKAVTTKIAKSNVGAGHSQLINVQACPHGGYYVPAGKSNDRAWFDGGRGQKAASDMQFRRRLKKEVQHIKMPLWFSDNVIHLNHIRDNELGKHSEEQR